MDFVAVQKFVKVSPKKLRLVAGVAGKMTPLESIERLPFLNKGGSKDLLKVIKTAVSNAKTKEVSDDSLKFKEIQINEGPRLKRGRPVSRGRWHPILKRMSHIRVVLTTVEPKIKKQGALPESKGTAKDGKSKIKDENTKTQSKVKKENKTDKSKK